MTEIEKIKEEINRTRVELIMSGCSDGWWNKYMEEKLITLEDKLKELNNDNNRILDKKD